MHVIDDFRFMGSGNIDGGYGIELQVDDLSYLYLLEVLIIV